MPNGAALEFKHLFEDSTEPIETEEDCDGPHFLEKFFSAALYDAGVGDGHAAKLAVESARIDARAKTIFKKIAATAAAKTSADSSADAGRLGKRATGKVSRVEITRYLTGEEVHAELDANNQVIRTFTKNAGQQS